MRSNRGFDLSEVEDFTSACLEFPLEDNRFFVLEHSWVPARKVKENHEKLDWRRLQESGWLTVCEGDYVAFERVLEWFEQMQKAYLIDAVGYDPAKAFQLVQAMTQKGFVMDPVRQGELTLTGPLDNLKERFLDGKILHNRNDLFTWYLGNVKLSRRSAGATYLPTKQNKYRKIDGFAALLDAHTEYLRKNPLYIPEDRELTTKISLKL